MLRVLPGVLLAAATLAPTVLLPTVLAASPGGPVMVQDKRISESSGLVASPTHPGLVWTVNDSGDAAIVYGVRLRTGRTVARLRLAGAQARDWEAMTGARGADGRGLLWIGDIGDNRAVRDSVLLHLVVEPRAVTSQTVSSHTVSPVSVRVRYPDGPHNAETLIWTPDGRLLLVTKDVLSGVIYQVPPVAVRSALAGRSTPGPALAVRLGSIAMLVTDGAALPDGRIILRDYDGAAIYPNPRAGGTLSALRRLVLPAQPQGETLAVVDDGAAVLVGSEGVRQLLHRVPLPAKSTPSTPSDARSPSPSPVAPGPKARAEPAPGEPVTRLAPLAIGAGLLALTFVAGRRRWAARRR